MANKPQTPTRKLSDLDGVMQQLREIHALMQKDELLAPVSYGILVDYLHRVHQIPYLQAIDIINLFPELLLFTDRIPIGEVCFGKQDEDS